MKKLVCLLLLFLNITISSFAQREQDSLALVALYNSTGGANWTNKTNWLSSEPISNWYGVTLMNNRVKNIELRSNNLAGSLPKEIGNLTNLEYLTLFRNRLTGTIPIEIGNLINLTQLFLNDNNFSGNIPQEVGNLINLNCLQLATNQISGTIPKEIGNLTKLNFLYLYANHLSGSIPLEICKLKNLNDLCLEWNQLSGNIPPELGDLSNLWGLTLHHNQLSGSIPSEIGKPNLQILYLDNNQLTGSIPKEIGNLKNLTYFSLQNNQLSGTIPPEIWKLSNLKTLLLSLNKFTGSIPIEINNLSSLEDLEISNNQFNNLPALTSDSLDFLWIQNNRLTFIDIEPNIKFAKKHLLYSPQDSIGTKQNIISRTGKTYTFAVTCGGANNIYQWYKNNTVIPSATKSTYKIAKLKQSDTGTYTCAVTNAIVTGLTINSRPIKLNVSMNSRALDSLALVTLYNSTGGTSWTKNTNWLSNQPISAWYGVTVGSKGTKDDSNDTTSVIKLDLSNNNLSGTIPKEIGNMTALQTLNLDNNHLSGTVPEGINNLSFLQTLELSNNKLSDLPTLTLSSLNTLLINNNEFSFEDIVPNLSVPTNGFNYLSQDSMGVRKDTLCRVGKSIKFVAVDSANHNSYLWYKDGTAITTGTSNYYQLSNLQESDSGSYTCKITNTIVPGLTINQRPIKLHVSIKTGVNDIDINALKVYPNPTCGIIYFEIDRSLPANTKIVITDIYGKAVFIKVLEVSKKQELNLTRLSKGIYFLQIQNQNARCFQKVIIQ